MLMKQQLLVFHMTSALFPRLLVVWPCTCRGMLLGKTVVLATNQLQFVSAADKVLYISGGRVVESGSYADLLAAGGPFAAMMREAQVCCVITLPGQSYIAMLVGMSLIAKRAIKCKIVYFFSLECGTMFDKCVVWRWPHLVSVSNG